MVNFESGFGFLGHRLAWHVHTRPVSFVHNDIPFEENREMLVVAEGVYLLGS